MRFDSDPNSCSRIGAGLVVVLLACGTGDRRSEPVSVRETLGTTHAVEVRGLPRDAARRLASLTPDDATWRQLVAVTVDDSTRQPTTTPTIIGRYVVTDGAIRFEPRFPFTDGVAYRVAVDTAALSGDDPTPSPNAERLRYHFEIPAVARARTTRVTTVHPSTPRLPANLLRWYIETSAPMEPGNALDHVHLLDESGREVEGAFLALDQELWDPARQRLTLLLDPGRVKRGVRTNVESGAPLVAGRRYRLVIDRDWKDGMGAELASGFELSFEAVADDRSSPSPERWRLTLPTSGTRSLLRVAFGESLDHALAGRLIDVVDARDRPVPGTAALVGDSAWTFVPSSPWAAGDYTLRVGGALEDLAGNNVVRVFDVDARHDSTAIDRDVAASTRRLRFRIL